MNGEMGEVEPKPLFARMKQVTISKKSELGAASIFGTGSFKVLGVAQTDKTAAAAASRDVAILGEEDSVLPSSAFNSIEHTTSLSLSPEEIIQSLPNENDHILTRRATGTAKTVGHLRFLDLLKTQM